MSKQIRDVWAVATATAQRMGYKDFSAGSPGREKRDEIAEELKVKKQTKRESVFYKPTQRKFPRVPLRVGLPNYNLPPHGSTPGALGEAAARREGVVFKGGPGSGRKPGSITRAKEGFVAPTIQRYQQERTPAAHQEMLEAFRQREKIPQSAFGELETLEHPWDVKKLIKALENILEKEGRRGYHEHD